MLELVGVDTGGTFTDFILYKNGSFVSYKIPSTPEAPEKAIIAGLKHLCVDLDNAHIVHGTTVATNALLEGKGAKTAFITNTGLKDLLHIGRQARDQLYSLCPQAKQKLIDAKLCFELDTRVSADGEQLVVVNQQQIERLKQQLAALDVDSVAICLLFAFLNDNDERTIEKALAKDFFVSRSSHLFPEQREYERAVVTWINSYLGPKTQTYLSDLQTQLERTIHVLQSDATTLPATTAGGQAVRLLLSGPAGGVLAASVIARECEQSKLLTLDMGGTSTDVSLIAGSAKFTNDSCIAEFPLAITMLDIHTIGAGGGSIARVDDAGGLHVGPESSGAQPGPACYAKGGEHATITDANVVLGRLPTNTPWKSGLQLDKSEAMQVIQAIASEMNCTPIEAAQGIVDLANAHMVEALRVISIQRGHDPSQFSLFPFGGAGGLHMCAVAEQLGIQQILVPLNAGILSAQGMLYAPVGHMSSRSICQPLDDLSVGQMTQLFSTIEQQAQQHLQDAGIQAQRSEYWLDCRYQGQSSTISLSWNDKDLVEQFSRAHKRRYGFVLDEQAIELVTLRVWVYQDMPQPEFSDIQHGPPAAAIDFVLATDGLKQIPVFMRQDLVCEQVIQGPSILLDDASTFFIEAGWQGRVLKHGHIRLQMQTDCL